MTNNHQRRRITKHIKLASSGAIVALLVTGLAGCTSATESGSAPTTASASAPARVSGAVNIIRVGDGVVVTISPEIHRLGLVTRLLMEDGRRATPHDTGSFIESTRRTSDGTGIDVFPTVGAATHIGIANIDDTYSYLAVAPIEDSSFTLDLPGDAVLSTPTQE